MGFFSWLTTSKKLSEREIREKLFRVATLTQQERAKVIEALRPFLSGGGVSAQELNRALRGLRGTYAISDIDRKNIIAALFGKGK